MPNNKEHPVTLNYTSGATSDTPVHGRQFVSSAACDSAAYEHLQTSAATHHSSSDVPSSGRRGC